MRISKKALPIWSAFFLFWAVAVEASCPQLHSAERVQVEHVYDGDTVRLSDGRRIRIIGINAPETAKKDRAGEYLADDSTEALKGLLQSGQVSLLLGEEPQDRYKRWLGHLFVDGRLVSEQLLLQGLAFHVAIPPNLKFSHCLQVAERNAGSVGLWAEYSDIRKPVLALKKGESGFRILSGEVSAIKKIKQGYLIEIDQRLAVRIDSKLIKQISSLEPATWKGASVQVRGWIKAKSVNAPSHYSPWFLAVSHPSQLKMH